MKSSVALLVVSLIALSACNSTDDNANIKIETKKTTELMNGMTAEEAYAQFHFTVKGTCEKPSGIWFEPSSTESIQIGAAADKTAARLVIYMNKNGNYTARYDETRETGCKTENGATWCTQETTYNNDKLNGRWTVEGKDLVLHGIGTATYFGTINDKHTMALTIGKDFVSSKVIGKKTRVMKTATNVGENGQSINQYCGITPSED